MLTEKPRVPNREVTKLLHQQIKERKAMIAERTKNDKELEKALMKIQKQLEENQNQSAEIVQVCFFFGFILSIYYPCFNDSL